MRIPAFFNEAQLSFQPRYEWAFGKRIKHPETTRRADKILGAIKKEPTRFDLRTPVDLPLTLLRRIHSYNLLTLYNTAAQLGDGEDLYPNVFPREMAGRGDPMNLRQAGAYCFDSGTPLNRHVWTASAWSAACARDAAVAVRKGEKLTYALSRPPGHHAQKDAFGGYCYFNNAAVAAHVLKRLGRVAIVDIDFHHGNGTQELFYRDGKVLVINIHGDPREFFPFFCGFATETGKGKGLGFNINVPLPGGTTGPHYVRALRKHVFPALRHFDPAFVVLSAGLDGYERDPVGGFLLTTDDFEKIGAMFGRLKLPTVVVQEGGYYTPHLGYNAMALLEGLALGMYGKQRWSRDKKVRKSPKNGGPTTRPERK